jgi:hypothetical protein
VFNADYFHFVLQLLAAQKTTRDPAIALPAVQLGAAFLFNTLGAPHFRVIVVEHASSSTKFFLYRYWHAKRTLRAEVPLDNSFEVLLQQHAGARIWLATTLSSTAQPWLDQYGGLFFSFKSWRGSIFASNRMLLKCPHADVRQSALRM